MPRQDFYITFGSDITAFNAGLLKELARTEKIIGDFESRINKVGTGAATSPLGKLLDRIATAEQTLHAAAGTAATGGKASAATGTDAAEIRKAMQTFTTELRRTISQLTKAAPSARNAPTAAAAGTAETQRATTDDAGIGRVVEAVDRNVSATARVEGAVNRLTATLRARATGRRAPARQQQQRTPTEEVLGAANSEQQLSQRAQPFTSAEAQREYYTQLARIRPELAEIVNEENKLAAAVRLVTQGQLNQTEAVDLLGNAFGRTRREAQQNLSTALANQRITERAAQLQAAADQRAREEEALRNAPPAPAPGATPAAGAAGGPNAAAIASARQNGAAVGGAMGTSARDTFSSIFGNTGFYGRVLHSVGTFLVRNVSAGLVFGLTNALQDAITQGVATESTFVRVSEALKDTGRNTDGLRTSLQGLSLQYGVSLQDVYETAAGLTGLFDSSDKANKGLIELTKTAVQLELISGGALNATEAMTALSSVTSAYAQDTPQHIADVATVIQNQLSVNIEETTEGVARLSGQTAELGINFEHAATYVAAISKFTAQSGAGAGEQLSRMLASLQTGRTQAVVSRAFNQQGINIQPLFNARDYQSALDTILGHYQELTKAQKDQVATAIGGQRQAASTNALLIRGSQVLNTITSAERSHGAAQERAAALSQNLNAQLRRLQAGFVNLFAVMVRMGVFDAVGIILRSLVTVLTQVDKGLSTFQDTIDKVPGLHDLEQLLLIVGGLAAGFALARKAAQGFMAVLALGGVARARVAGGAAAGAAEGGAVAEGGAAAGGAAGQAGLLALLLGGGRRRARTPISAARYLPASMASAAAAAESGRYLIPTAEASAAAFYTQRFAPAAVGATGFFTRPRGIGAYPRDAMGYDARLGYGPAVPSGRVAGFYARRSVNLTNVSERFSARAASATERVAARGTGGVARGAANLADRSLAVGSRAAATTTNALSNGLAAMSRNAFLATSGLLGLVGVFAVVSNGIHLLQQESQEYKTAYQQTFGKKDVAASTGSPEADQARDLFQKASDDIQAHNQGLISGMSKAWVNTFSSAFHGRSIDAQAKRDVGDTTGTKEDDDYFRVLRTTFGRLDAFWKGTAVTSKNVSAAMNANEKDIQKYADEINNSGLSTAQKDSLLASLADMQGRLESSGNKWALVAAGLNKTDALTTDQLQGIGSMVQALSSYGNTTLRMYQGLIGQYIGSLGFNENNVVASDLRRLATGRVTTTRYRQAGVARPGAGVPSAAQQVEEGRPRIVMPTPITEVVTKTHAMTATEKNALSEKSLKDALKVAQAQLVGRTDKDSDDYRAQLEAAMGLLNQYNQAVQQRLQTAAANAEAMVTHERNQGDFAAAARDATGQLRALQQQVKEGYLTQQQYQAQADDINDQIAQDRASAASKQFDEAKLHTRNQLALATLEVSSASAALNALQADPHTKYATLQAAQQRYYSAINAQQDAQNQYALSMLQTQQQLNAPINNARVNARNAVKVAALQMQQAAATYGRDSSEYEDALRSYNEAQKSLTQAMQDRAKSVYDVLIAQADAAGHTVKAARLTLQQAQLEYTQALRDAGGDRKDPTVRSARAQEINAQAGVRDAVFQDALDTINFNQQMGYITSAAAIAQLQNLLKMHDLTTAERRQVLEQIHGLQQDLVSQLTSSGFNIPGEIQLPTAYQVRRSLGIDKAQTLVKESVNDLTNAATPSSALAGASSNSVINALNQVRDAVTAKGAQQVSFEQKNTYNVPTASVAKQIANQVIALINQQNGQQVRANTSTPRLVQTR